MLKVHGNINRFAMLRQNCSNWLDFETTVLVCAAQKMGYRIGSLQGSEKNVNFIPYGASYK